MPVSRRLFVSGSLFCVFGAWSIKELLSPEVLPISPNNVESFFDSYELSISVEESSDAFGETEILEQKLGSLLSTEGLNGTIVTIDRMIRDDYQMGKIRSMNGWIVSEVEFGLLILRNRYV